MPNMSQLTIDNVTYDLKDTDLKAALSSITGTKQIEMTEGAYYDLLGSSITIGSPTSYSTKKYALVSCTEGDVFTISGNGANRAQPWGFVDSSGNILAKEGNTGSVTIINKVIVAPPNSAYLVLNNDKADTLISYCGRYLVDIVSDNKNAVMFDPCNFILTSFVENGSINSTNGSKTNDNTRLRTGLIDVSNDDYISAVVKTGFRIVVLFYNSDGSYAGSSTTIRNITESGLVNVSGYAKIKAVIINNSASSSYVMPYDEIKNNYLFRNVAVGSYSCGLTGYYFEYDAHGMYFKYSDYIYIRGSLSWELPAIGNTGITLVTSPFGVTDCIYIAHAKALVFNTATKAVSVIDMSELKDFSTLIPLLCVNRTGSHDGCIGGLLSTLIADHGSYFAQANSASTFTCESKPYFEYTTFDGIYFNSNGKIYLRGNDSSGNMNGTWNGMATMPFIDSTSFVTSPMGKTNCLHIPHNYSLIYVPYVAKFKIIANDSTWCYPCSVLVFKTTLNSRHEIIADGAGKSSVVEYENDKYSSTKRNLYAEFCEAFNNTADGAESFMFFSDPHVAGASNNFDNDSFDIFINELQYGYDNTPTSFIVDGGDWLNYGDYQSTACFKLGLIDGNMRKRFPNYYPINGNHDTNYQGVVSEDDSSRGDLSLATITNLRFRENGHKAYYSFDGIVTKNYVFDSGIDWGSQNMDSYRWEQVDWFANKLIADDDPYGIVWVHIAFMDYETLDPTVVSALMSNVGEVISAYNNRATVTLNEHTYNFTECTGKIWFIMCGHIHADLNGTLGGVPVVSVPNTMNGDKVTYDLCIADFGNNKLKIFRVGTGSNNEIAI